MQDYHILTFTAWVTCNLVPVQHPTPKRNQPRSMLITGLGWSLLPSPPSLNKSHHTTITDANHITYTIATKKPHTTSVPQWQSTTTHTTRSSSALHPSSPPVVHGWAHSQQPSSRSSPFVSSASAGRGIHISGTNELQPGQPFQRPRQVDDS